MRNICAVVYSLGVEKACLVLKQYIHQHGAEAEKQCANVQHMPDQSGVNVWCCWGIGGGLPRLWSPTACRPPVQQASRSKQQWGGA